MIDLYSPDAECNVIGCVLLNSNVLLEITLQPDDFYITEYRKIWQTILEFDRADRGIDVFTVAEATGINIIELSKMVDNVGLTLYARDYAQIVKDKAKRRRYLEIAKELANLVHKEETIETGISRVVDELVAATANAYGAVHISAFTGNVMSEIDKRRENPDTMWGFKTDLVDFDRITGGIQLGESIVISGEPKVGKSLLVDQMARQIAGHGVPGAIYSIEMKGEPVARRMLSAESKINTRKMKTGNLTDQEYERIERAKFSIDNIPLFMSDASNWDLLSLRSDLARMKHVHKIKFFVVDYMYLINTGIPNETEATTVISRGIKHICKSLDLAGISIHSMNKTGGLRGSGQISYDADMVCMLTKDEMQPSVRHFKIAMGRELESDTNTFTLVKQENYPYFGAGTTSKVIL
jgi:replicative DNA helicase